MTGTASVRFRDQLKAAPLILQAYIIFAAVAGILSLSVFYAPSFYEKLLPYTGWTGLFFYLMFLGPAHSAIATPRRKEILGLAFCVAFVALFGLFDTYLHTHGPLLAEPGETNPYLAYHAYRPLVTILVPGVWSLLILFLLPKRWTKGA